jgi:hypothetical protein
MKKYLIAGALALICNGLLTSCSEDLDNYSSLEEAKKAQFAQNFEKFYGTPNPNQDWGFNDDVVAAARTRTVVKADMTNYPSDIAPAAVTPKEAEWVTNWFKEHEGLSEKGKDWSNFFLQFVSGDLNNKKGLWHRYDQNRINNGYASNYWDEEFTDNGVMDYLIVTNNNGYKEHVNDFNSNSGGPHSIVYMENSSALYFGYHSSWDNHDYQYFRLKELEVPGSCFSDNQPRKGWYVGLSYYGKKNDNGDKELGIQRLQYADDWILKVVPGEVLKKKEIKEHKWVFCEDLGSSSDHRDFDYNDLVFDAKIIEEYEVVKDNNGNETEYGNEGHTIYAEITPLAAGGELLITFGSSGKSAHNLFASHPAKNVMINTCKDGEDYVLSHVEGLAGETFKYDFGSSQPSIKNIPIIVRTTSGTATALYELTAETGDAPNKICVPPGTRWLYEQKPIDSAYPVFYNYVTDGTPEPWSVNVEESNLYTIEDLSEFLTISQKDKVFYVPVDESLDPVESNYNIVNPNYEEELWSDATGSMTFYTKDDGKWDGNVFIDTNSLTAAKIGEGTIIRFYFASDNGYMIKVSDNDWNNFDLENDGWDDNFIQGGAKNGYVEFKLTTTIANHLKKNGLRIYGTGLTALALTYDNSQKTTDVIVTGNQLWPESGTGNETDQITFNGNKFNDVTANQLIHIYASFGPDNWYNCYFNFNDWAATQGIISIDGWRTEYNQIWATNNAKVEDGFILPLNDTLISWLKAKGITFVFGNLTVTKITVENK